MSMITVLKPIKQIHEKDIVLIKIGGFYHAYGRDSYILSYLFDYKLKNFEKQYVTCGFPTNNISKIMTKLEDEKINYIMLDKRNNYEEEEKSNNGNLNSYDKFYEKAKKYVNLKRRIDNIYDILLKEIEKDNIKEKIKEIEEVVYEGRKI